MYVCKYIMVGLLFCLPVTATKADDADRANKRKGKQRADTTIRVSEMIGMDIQNDKGKSVGEVHDIVLDAESGRVRYAAVTYGGLLGVGNKLFAVPYEAFRCQANPDDPGERVLILNVTAERLKHAEGFDEDHWPDFGNRKFTQGLTKIYGIERRSGNRDLDRATREPNPDR